MASLVIIIISVNFQIKQLSAKFLSLTISYSCCSIPISFLVLPCVKVGGATSQLDLQSLTPLSVGGCGRLQLGALHWGT